MTVRPAAVLTGRHRLNPHSTAVASILVAIAGFAIRVWLPYRAVLGGSYVAFTEPDAWYHLRLVDALVRHFPCRIWHDAYLLHPGGEPVDVAPFFDWLMAAVALVFGAGAPSESLIDLVGVWIPPTIGAVTVAVIYLAGRETYSPRAGLWAAIAAAVMPGQLLLRSALGFADHHCLEILFVALLFLLAPRAFDASRSSKVRFAWALAAGLVLGLYLLTWAGGAIVVLLLTVWAGWEAVRSNAGSEEAASARAAATPIFGLAALVVSPWATTRPFFAYDLLSLAGGAVFVIALRPTARWVSRARRWRVVTALALLGLAAAIGLYLSPGLRTQTGRLSPARGAQYVTEAMPLVRSASWRPLPLWNEFTTSLVTAVLGMGALVSSPRRLPPGARLVIVFAGGMLAATIGQVRFAYYLAISVALLSGIGCDKLLGWVSVRAEREREPGPSTGLLAACILLAAAIALPGAPAFVRASRATAALTPAWFSALLWLRGNTPEPFEDPDAYYRVTPSGRSAYGVLSWWDSGYWIARVGRRVPVTNPRQTAADEVARYFLSQEPEEAAAILSKLGARYVVAEAKLQPTLDGTRRTPGFFAGMMLASGHTATEYCRAFVPLDGGPGAEPQYYCSAAYYRTMAARLYAFGGKAVTPRSIWVIDFDEPAAGRGSAPRVLAERSFERYQEAEQYLAQHPSAHSRIVSKSLVESCVPLETLEHYSSVYRSLERQPTGGVEGPPLVQVFEYRPR